jgi:uncharacterized protein YndB with AHSA1/START domain
MPRIFNSIEINRPIDEVYEYITTPAHWPDWHTTALSVSGATERSLDLGESVNEEVKVMGRRSQAEWTVQERQRPTRWVISGTIAAGASAVITYTLTPTAGGGTTFGREVVYDLPALLELVDGVIIRPRLESEADASLAQLKAQMEGTA